MMYYAVGSHVICIYPRRFSIARSLYTMCITYHVSDSYKHNKYMNCIFLTSIGCLQGKFKFKFVNTIILERNYVSLISGVNINMYIY
jgi:hypothetical protein